MPLLPLCADQESCSISGRSIQENDLEIVIVKISEKIQGFSDGFGARGTEFLGVIGYVVARLGAEFDSKTPHKMPPLASEK